MTCDIADCCLTRRHQCNEAELLLCRGTLPCACRPGPAGPGRRPGPASPRPPGAPCAPAAPRLERRQSLWPPWRGRWRGQPPVARAWSASWASAAANRCLALRHPNLHSHLHKFPTLPERNESPSAKKAAWPFSHIALYNSPAQTRTAADVPLSNLTNSLGLGGSGHGLQGESPLHGPGSGACVRWRAAG